jgi:hypothetical protein
MPLPSGPYFSNSLAIGLYHTPNVFISLTQSDGLMSIMRMRLKVTAPNKCIVRHLEEGNLDLKVPWLKGKKWTSKQDST